MFHGPLPRVPKPETNGRVCRARNCWVHLSIVIALPYREATVNEEQLLRDPELQRVMWAYCEVWNRAAGSESERQVCTKWVKNRFEERFGGGFHQSRLATLAKFGFLTPGWLTRGKSRRHYLLNDPPRVLALVSRLVPHLSSSIA
jgi:hypothetical protein